MNGQLPLTDDAIRAAIARRATSSGERGLRERVLAATAAVPQRRGWRVRLDQALTLPERRAMRTLAIAVVVLLAMALSLAFVGSQFDRPTPPPLGGLAYLSQGDLYVAGPAGESPRLVWDTPAFGDAAPNSLVWLDSETVLLNISSLSQGGAHVVDVTTGANRVLDPGGYMALSPDRRLVAIGTFDEGATPQHGVRLIEIASGAIVGDIPGTIGGYPPTWSPDGRSILGESPDTIYRVDIASGERPILATGLCCGLSPHWPTWSSDGSRVVYVDYHLPPSRQDSIPGSERDCSFRCGTLWMVDADGGEPTRLTPELGSEIMPAFSPDGRWIAYIEENIDGIVQREDLAVIAADGSGRRLLTPDVDISLVPNVGLPNGRTFAWDPDSGGLLYLRFDGSLWHITLDGVASRIGTPAMSEFARQVVP